MPFTGIVLKELVNLSRSSPVSTTHHSLRKTGTDSTLFCTKLGTALRSASTPDEKDVSGFGKVANRSRSIAATVTSATAACNRFSVRARSSTGIYRITQHDRQSPSPLRCLRRLQEADERLPEAEEDVIAIEVTATHLLNATGDHAWHRPQAHEICTKS